MDTRNNRSTLIFGGLLVAFGLLFLISELTGFTGIGSLWPLIVILAGGAFFVGMVLGGPSAGPLAIPGSIITTVGLILLVQNQYGWWDAWSYAWALIIVAVGVGLIINGYYSANPELRQRGWSTLRTGVALFLIFGAFFNILLNHSLSPFWPVLLIAVGLYQIGERIFRMLRGEQLTGDRLDMFGPIFLAGIGVVLLLNTLGVLPAGRLLQLLSLWPLLLIAAGFQLIFGRRSLVISSIAGLLVVAVMIFVALFGDRLKLPASPFINFGEIGSGELVRGSGTVAEETRPVGDISKLRFTSVGLLEIVQGSAPSLVISADDNLLPYITTTTIGSELTISARRGYNLQPAAAIRYRLTVTDLSSLEISGAGETVITGLQTKSLEIDLSGAGSLKLSGLQLDKLDINLSGAGSIDAAGQAADLRVELSGAGSYNGPDLQSASADISISGLGSATLWVTDRLDASISGLGSIAYYGDPQVTSSRGGLGSVRRLGSK